MTIETEPIWCRTCKRRTVHDLDRCMECQTGPDENALEVAGQVPLFPTDQVVS